MSEVILKTDPCTVEPIKSQDKLEIQMEEQSLTQKTDDTETGEQKIQNGENGSKIQNNENGGKILSVENGSTIQNGEAEAESHTPKDVSKLSPNESKSPKKSKLSFRLPAILRKRQGAETSSVVDKEKEVAESQPEIKVTSPALKTELVKVTSEVTSGGVPEVTNGGHPERTMAKGSFLEVTSLGVPELAKGSSPEVINGGHAEVAEVGKREKGKVDDDIVLELENSASASFLSAFSTPRWTNFRRVFSFNRSTPAPLAQEIDLHGIVPVSVILNIEDGDEMKDEKNVEKTDDDLSKRNEENGRISQEKSFISPLLGLLTKSRKNSNKHFKRDLDPGSGVGFPVKSTKSEQQVSKTQMGENPEKVDSTQKNTQPKLDDITQDSLQEGGAVASNGLCPSKDDQNWGERFLSRISASKKLVLAGASGILLVLAATTIILFYQPTHRSIDIASLIIEGKFINTMTSCGQVQGVLEDGGYAFRGIPYALPPVGELRWRPAQSQTHLSHCWNGTYSATRSASPCWQFYRNGNYDGSEDCLYLDVYTPKPYYDSPVPTVIFIGGESLNGGESATVRPSTKLAVQKNVVFVSVSIRRSVLGFLTVEPLSRNSYPMTSGNYGLSDLLAALNWVKINAQHFGGDPNHVTLLGHQSGGSLILALLSTHLSKGLFHQVWISGGSPPTSLLSVQEAESQNEKFLKELGCTTIECLHNKGPEELLESVPNDWRMFQQDLPNRGDKRHHWLVRDGVILRDTYDIESDVPRSQLPSEALIKIPFVAGGSAEVDASPEMFSYLNWNDTSKFSAYLESSLGSFGPSLPREVIDRYFRPESTPWQTFASLLSDVRTICPLYYSAMNRADPYTKLPVYFYVATQRKLTPIGYIADTHADIGAILGTYVTENREERKFVKNMQKLFYEFVEKGHLPEIPDVTKSILKVDDNIQKIYTYPNCDFWQEHQFYPNHSRID